MVKKFQEKMDGKLNLYDTKQINCYRCGQWIGEVAFEALIINPKCGSCADPYPKEFDLLPSPKKILTSIQEEKLIVATHR